MWKAIKKKFSALSAKLKKLKAALKGRPQAVEVEKAVGDLEDGYEEIEAQRKKTIGKFDAMKKAVDSLDKEAGGHEALTLSERILVLEQEAREAATYLKELEERQSKRLDELEFTASKKWDVL